MGFEPNWCHIHVDCLAFSLMVIGKYTKMRKSVKWRRFFIHMSPQRSKSIEPVTAVHDVRMLASLPKLIYHGCTSNISTVSQLN